MRCPICGNAHISDKALFCKVCGAPLYESMPDIEKSPCGFLGDKDARFCEKCGHPAYKTRFGLEVAKDEI